MRRKKKIERERGRYKAKRERGSEGGRGMYV